MSVFTTLQRPELEDFLQSFALGRLHTYQGIAEGAENSNFFVSLDTGDYVLTLVERGERCNLPFTVSLLDRLHQAGLPVPFAVSNAQGQTLFQLAGKPALLQPRLPGRHILQPNAHHCTEVGMVLARMHLATSVDMIEHPSDRGLTWMHTQSQLLSKQLSGNSLELLTDVAHTALQLQQAWESLPKANLHADLFRDNVLFDGPHLSGIIDFHNACSGPMLYDVAIALNDWCSTAAGDLDEALADALLRGYAGLRPFTMAETHHWYAFLQVSCLRFWLSRLLAANTSNLPGVQIKPPVEFEQRLQHRKEKQISLPLAL